MMEVFARVERVASSACTVLVTGETGTGKELVAQAIHFSDATRQRPAGRGQLRGAARAPAGERALRPRAGCVHRRRPPEEGPVRAGQRGHALPRRDRRAAPWACRPSCSACSRTGRFERVGGTEPIQTDCRVIAATNLQPRRGRRRRPVPRGPVLPAQRRLDRAAPAARAARGHPAPGRTTSSRSWSERGLPAKTVAAGDPLAAAPLRLAGQRPRARARHRAGRGHHPRPGDRAREPAAPDRPAPRGAVQPRLRPRPPAPGDHRRVHPADRAGLPASASWRSTAAGSTAAPSTAGCRGGASARSSAATRSTRATSSPPSAAATSSPWRESEADAMSRLRKSRARATR